MRESVSVRGLKGLVTAEGVMLMETNWLTKATD